MSVIRRLYYSILLFCMFLWDLTLSSIVVARAVLSPRDLVRPRLVTVPLKASTPHEITLVANYITLTPGTLTLDVSADRRTLLIHDLLAGDSSEGTRAGISNGIEVRVLRATRS